MGPNRRALERERAAARAAEEAKHAEAERKAAVEAHKIVEIWNARQAGGRALWFYPTIGAAIAAGFPWLTFYCPGCRVVGSVDLRTLDRHPAASISSLIPSLSCRGSVTIVTTLTEGSSYLVLNGGTVSAQSITAGNTTASYISGYGIVNAPINGPFLIEAAGGTLSLLGSISGNYFGFPITIASGATVELGSGVTAGVDFAPNATLKLDAPSTFTGAMQVTGVTDTIDLVGIAASSATYSGTTLTINETNGQQLTYSVGGSVAGNTVKVASDNHGGTLVYWTTAPASGPSAPVITSLVGHPVTGSTIEVQGTGEVGDTVTLYADGGTTSVGTGTVAASGSFDTTTNTTFAAGSHTLTATETDAQGLTSEASASFGVTVGPTAPSITPHGTIIDAQLNVPLSNVTVATFSVSPVPNVFTLTTGPDTFVGGPQAETVVGTAATLNPGDSLSGGGNDTLALYGSGTFRVDQLANFTGFKSITLSNFSGGSAGLVLGSQTITVTGYGSGGESLTLGSGAITFQGSSGYNTIYSNAPSDWNAANAIYWGSS